ncbi:hypothetical protein HN873_019082 [Arachis hypogaea]
MKCRLQMLLQVKLQRGPLLLVALLMMKRKTPLCGNNNSSITKHFLQISPNNVVFQASHTHFSCLLCPNIEIPFAPLFTLLCF